MKKVHFFILFIFFQYIAFSQDCIDYYKYYCPIEEPNPYTMVPEGSKSGLLLRGEVIHLSFFIYQGRDYRIALCSEMYNGEVRLIIHDAEDGTILLYDNELNDMTQIFEFQVMQTRRVRCTIYVDEKTKKQKNFGLLTEKIERGCVAILTETMVTRK